MNVTYHVFLGGPLPEDTAYPTSMLLRLGGPVILGYRWTDELKVSTKNPDVSARVWRWEGTE